MSNEIEPRAEPRERAKELFDDAGDGMFLLEQFRQLVEHIDEVFWIASAREPRMLYVSPAYEKIWGRPVQSVLDDPDSWMELIHPDDRARVVEAQRAKWLRGAFDETYRIVRADGSERWIRDRGFPVIGPAGIDRVVGIAEDITQLRKTEEQLLHAQKMEAVGRLAGGITHDLNNILLVILSYSRLLIGDLKSGDPMIADLQEIQRAGERAAELTRQLQAFSRRQVLKPRIVDLNQIVAGMEKMLGRVLGEDIEVLAIPAPDPAFVSVDPGKMEQVLMNLAVNARDAMPGGGRLTLEIARVERGPKDAPGAHFVLRVADSGMGMDPATLARIFEPFFTTKPPGKGTGLGLSIVFGIVAQSGGTICVHTEPGRGSRFDVYLQEAEGVPCAVPSPVSAREHEAPPGGLETILLVEDDTHARKLVRATLERQGYRVLDAQSSGDALLIAEQHPGPIHLLLSDVVMPRMSGAQLAARLCALRPGLRVLYMSGYAGDAIPHGGPLRSSLTILQKPFAKEELLGQVREVLQGASTASSP